MVRTAFGMTKSIYSDLMAHVRQTEALEQVAGLLHWDQETMMPPRGGRLRSEHVAAVEAVRHERMSDARVGEWIAALNGTELDPLARRNVTEIRRQYRRATRMPSRLAEDIARTTAEAHSVWAAARKANSFADFRPMLEKIVALKRAEAACLKESGATLYDALIDAFEPGMRAITLTKIFARLGPVLSELRGRIAGSGRDAPVPAGHFPAEAQMALARKVAALFGYDFEAGRLDLALHPFSSGTMGDTRITTRIGEAEPFMCLLSTVHEVGHAVYEQNIDQALSLQPAGRHASMGVHESQSRLFENQIGRSRAFAEWLYPEMLAAFGPFGADSPDALYAMLNRVETGFIRTEADEVHYNLHIILRFELERDLIDGDLDAASLEGEWSTRFERMFGFAVPDAANGVLQDIHWAAGLFGYFPTYSLGNVYAAALFERMRADMPDLDAAVTRGDMSGIVAWLGERIHKHGNSIAPAELIGAATGTEICEEPLIKYLNRKFGALYGV